MAAGSAVASSHIVLYYRVLASSCDPILASRFIVESEPRRRPQPGGRSSNSLIEVRNITQRNHLTTSKVASDLARLLALHARSAPIKEEALTLWRMAKELGRSCKTRQRWGAENWRADCLKGLALGVSERALLWFGLDV